MSTKDETRMEWGEMSSLRETSMYRMASDKQTDNKDVRKKQMGKTTKRTFRNDTENRILKLVDTNRMQKKIAGNVISQHPKKGLNPCNRTTKLSAMFMTKSVNISPIYKNH